MLVVDNGERLDYADEPAITADPAVPIIRGDMSAKRVLSSRELTFLTEVDERTQEALGASCPLNYPEPGASRPR